MSFYLNVKVFSKKIKTSKPKKWSRKGECPSCGVSCGSLHSKDCNLIYLPFAKSF